MTNIALIIRRELGAYLRTPSGYLIAGGVLLLNGILFNTRAVGTTARQSEQVIQQFFIDAGGLTVVAAVLFSMRLLAEERAIGTHMLLFTSPVREVEIVIGKYLAAVVVLTLLTVLSFYLPALIFVNGRVSWGHIAAGYLGMFFLGAAILALGTFASSLVSNPFLAVILTCVLVAVLELGWWVGQSSSPPLSEVLAYGAPYMKHFHPFRRGLFQLSDVVYYLTLIYLALLAAVRVLQNQRWR